MSIYDYKDYRDFIEQEIKSKPKKGYGVQGRLAEATGMHSSFITNVLSGERQLTPEQGMAVAEFFQLNRLETEYLLKLVHLDRAATPKLRKFHQEELEHLKLRARGLKDPKNTPAELNQEAKAIFYSDWKYSAIRIASALPNMTPTRLATELNINIEIVHRILEFLQKHALVVQNEEALKIGPTFTRVRPGEPLVYRHHANWRQKAVESFSQEKPENINITAPFALSAKDAEAVKKMLRKNVEEIVGIVDPSPSEELWCLNLDWFRF